MAKHSKNRNVPESSSTTANETDLDVPPIIEENNEANFVKEHNATVVEKSSLKQKLLNMEAIVREVVHENNDLRTQAQG